MCHVSWPFTAAVLLLLQVITAQTPPGGQPMQQSFSVSQQQSFQPQQQSFQPQQQQQQSFQASMPFQPQQKSFQPPQQQSFQPQRQPPPQRQQPQRQPPQRQQQQQQAPPPPPPQQPQPPPQQAQPPQQPPQFQRPVQPPPPPPTPPFRGPITPQPTQAASSPQQGVFQSRSGFIDNSRSGSFTFPDFFQPQFRQPFYYTVNAPPPPYTTTSSYPFRPPVTPSVSQYLPQSYSNPQILSIEVQCQRQQMRVRVQFDQPFNGIIYSKGFFSDQSCRYVSANSRQATYTFSIFLDRCGTTFVDDFSRHGQAFLENTIVIQNNPNIQESSDTARRIRCLWTGQFDRTVTSMFNVDMLDVVTITYSGDSVESYMDIQVGRGPFAAPVTGLVRIGETLTMVIYVVGGEDFDIHVKDCTAHDGNPRNAIQLTDVRGCVIKNKLMGPWQKTRQTGNTGATVIGFSFIQAFKFPDKMEVYLECNIEICKFQCANSCPSHSGRRRRSVITGDDDIVQGSPADKVVSAPERVEPVKLSRGIRVVTPEDISVSQDGPATAASPPVGQEATSEICLSTFGFAVALSVALLVLLVACITTAILCYRGGRAKSFKSDPATLPHHDRYRR